MSRIDSAYDYYVSTYANKEVSRYDAHKKSDLRKVYNKIQKVNKDSPLYKILNLGEAQKYAIDIKENAKSIQNVVSSLSDKYGSFTDSFQKKVAVSSDEEKVGVTYIGDGTEQNQSESFRIAVQQLAAPQVNKGNFLENDAHSIRPGAYSFDLNTNAAAYEFQYSVSAEETNLDVLNKLARLVNRSNLGITAAIEDDGNNRSALTLTSTQTGLGDREGSLFSVSPDASTGSTETMGILGIDQVFSQAHNSAFTLNGKPHSAFSNTFSINNAFELTLKDVTGDEETTISFKPNTDAIADNIQTLVDVYNGIITTADAYAGSEASDGNRLQRDVASLSIKNQVSLESIGLMVADNGSVSIDKEILSAAVAPERAGETFETLSGFRDSIGNKAESIAVNPMNYVSKIIVAYKNPGHNFATPYISSIYAGMMLDDYV